MKIKLLFFVYLINFSKSYSAELKENLPLHITIHGDLVLVNEVFNYNHLSEDEKKTLERGCPLYCNKDFFKYREHHLFGAVVKVEIHNLKVTDMNEKIIDFDIKSLPKDIGLLHLEYLPAGFILNRKSDYLYGKYSVRKLFGRTIHVCLTIKKTVMYDAVIEGIKRAFDPERGKHHYCCPECTQALEICCCCCDETCVIL